MGILSALIIQRGVHLNYIDLFFIVIFFVMIFSGYMKGFLVSLLSSLRFIISVPLSLFIANNYSDDIYNAFLYEPVYNRVIIEIDKSGIESVMASVRDIFDSLPFALSEKVDSSFLDYMNAEKEELALEIMKNIINPLAIIICKIVIFVLTIVAFYAITCLIIKYFKKKNDDKDAPLHKTNRFMGAVFGLIKAGAFVFAFTAIFYFITGISEKNTFVNEIETSTLYNALKYHPLITYLMGE